MDFQAILLLYIKMGLYYSIKLDLLAITPMSNEQMIHTKNHNMDPLGISIMMRHDGNSKNGAKNMVFT